jgi:hypothetical protein
MRKNRRPKTKIKKYEKSKERHKKREYYSKYKEEIGRNIQERQMEIIEGSKNKKIHKQSNAEN